MLTFGACLAAAAKCPTISTAFNRAGADRLESLGSPHASWARRAQQRARIPLPAKEGKTEKQFANQTIPKPSLASMALQRDPHHGLKRDAFLEQLDGS